MVASAPAGAGEQTDPVDTGQVVHRAGLHRRHPATLAAGRRRAGVGGGVACRHERVGRGHRGGRGSTAGATQGGREALLAQWDATAATTTRDGACSRTTSPTASPCSADEVVWDEVALREHALLADDALAVIGIPSTRGMAPSLHLNLGDGYLRQGRVEEAQASSPPGWTAADALGDDGYGHLVLGGLERLAERLTTGAGDA